MVKLGSIQPFRIMDEYHLLAIPRSTPPHQTVTVKRHKAERTDVATVQGISPEPTRHF